MNIPVEERNLNGSFFYVENYIDAQLTGMDIGFKLEKEFEDMIPGYLGEFFYKGAWRDERLAKRSATVIFEQIVEIMRAKSL